MGHLVQPPCFSRQVLNISREGDSTTSLGSLFQCSITLRVKKFFLMFSWNFLCFNGCKCPACPQSWPMLQAVCSWRREEYFFLKSVGTLKPKCKGRTNQLCTWFQLSVPISMLPYGLSSILSLAVVKTCMHLREDVVLRALVAAGEAPGSCLSFLRHRACWLYVSDGKSHLPARLPLLENTVLLDNHSLTSEFPLWIRRIFCIGSKSAFQLNGLLI